MLFQNIIAISGVLDDPRDPAAADGITFIVGDRAAEIPATSYTLTAVSSNPAVVPPEGITIAASDGGANVRIKPSSVGYTTISLVLASGNETGIFMIHYAASAAAKGAETFWHTGNADGSAALALDDDYMLIAEDERNVLNVYHRRKSGFPVATFEYGDIPDLGLGEKPGLPQEVDVEGIVKSPFIENRVYFIGSSSNQSTKKFDGRPNRNRVFAVDITGTGASTKFNYSGCVKNVRQALIAWGTIHGLDLATSAASGADPKLINGFNIEGMAFAPDGATLYIAFRAPLVQQGQSPARSHALIAPILDFEAFFNDGGPAGDPVIGPPVLLNLGRRGIRDIARIDDHYIILGGDYGDKKDFGEPGDRVPGVFRWSGDPGDEPVRLRGFDVSGLNPEGVLPVYENGVLIKDRLQIVSDDGTIKLYDEETEAKDLLVDNFKKFRSVILTEFPSA